ncbi:MAG: tRNA dihydrouridine synthase DusB [Lachnospiraceae bacterium]|nr:tRNA dihydrouridine synthase DusB [Lachnospiraceae bacterium]
MAGVTDAAFRSLCAEMGAGACVTEMVSAKALYYRNRGTEKLLRSPMDRGLLGLQLFGSDPEILTRMALEKQEEYDWIDLNMGCPMPKIVGNGEGSALLEKPELAAEIIRSMSRTLRIPLTVKMRIGLTRERICGRDFALMAEEAGAAALFVHGRTRAQLYSGEADWEEICRIREALSIPVIGNGDIDSAETALRRREESGCQGIMVGRSVRGNPWLFREIKAAWLGKEIPPRPDRKEMAELLSEHIEREIQEKGEAVGCRELRKHLAWYTAGMPRGASLRAMAARIATRQEAEAFVKAFLTH